MRLLHTSDWHLGHTLKEVTREYEHQAFLTWLLETCAREHPDVLLITGDVFDSATPPASAERMWFDFLAAVRRVLPALDVIAIAGNHDSPARLGAASAVLRELGVHVIGGLPRDASGAIDLERVLIPVANGRGLVAAVPFIRPIDLPPVVDRNEPGDPLGAIYGEVIAGARARKAADQALVITGHLYVAGADVSFLSERRVSIGGQESVSSRLFPDDIDYVALGHIHRAQRIGRDTMRYAGAPIALSLEEGHYKHQVVVVDFADGKVAGLRQLMIPRAIEIIRLGPAPLLEIVAEIAALPARGDRAIDPTRPYLEVIVSLDRPEPRLRQMIETALDGKRPRLVRLGVEHTGDGATLADHGYGRRLAELDPRDVFARCWAKNHAEPPGTAVLDAFDRLLADVRGDAELLS